MATQPAVTPSPSRRNADPEELTRAKWRAVMAVLRNKELDGKARADEIEKIASSVIDFALMAKLALGRTHWRQFTRAQRTRFVTLFVKRLKSSYRKRIAMHKDEEARFGPSVSEGSLESGVWSPELRTQDSRLRTQVPGSSSPRSLPSRRPKTEERRPKTAKTRRKGTVHVPIELVSNDKTVVIVHKFRRVGKAWTIYDIEIEGVSMLLTYRSQFDDILRRGTAEDLLSRLEQKSPD